MFEYFVILGGLWYMSRIVGQRMEKSNTGITTALIASDESGYTKDRDIYSKLMVDAKRDAPRAGIILQDNDAYYGPAPESIHPYFDPFTSDLQPNKVQVSPARFEFIF